MPKIPAPGLVTCVVAAVVFTALVCPGPAPASITMEREIGDEFLAQARRQLPLITDYELNSFISGLGQRLVATLGTQPFKYEFEVVRDGDLNAFAVPGGKIFLHAGLVAKAGSEDEVAGVLAHEIAHSHAHHVIRQQKKSAVSSYAALLGLLLTAVHPAIGQAAAIAAGSGTRLKYQRDFEREADFLGLGYARKAGFEPAAMLRFLRTVHSEQKLNPTYLPPYLRSHPLTAERLAYLESSLGQSEWAARPTPASWPLQRAKAIARAAVETRRQAVPDYERRLAAASAAERAGALELIGLLMAHGQEWDSARRYLAEAEGLGREVNRELGRVYLREGRLSEARPRLERAVALRPRDWNAWGDLGLLAYEEGRYGEAVQRLEESLELHAYRPALRRSLARALDKDGRSAEGFYHLAWAAEAEGHIVQAHAYYEKAAAGLAEGSRLKAEADKKVEEMAKRLPRKSALPSRKPPADRVSP